MVKIMYTHTYTLLFLLAGPHFITVTSCSSGASVLLFCLPIIIHRDLRNVFGFDTFQVVSLSSLLSLPRSSQEWYLQIT